MGEARRRRKHNDLLTNPRCVIASYNDGQDSPVQAFLLTPFPEGHSLTPEECEEIEAFIYTTVTETLRDPRQAWGPETPIAKRRSCHTPQLFIKLTKTAGRLRLRTLVNDSEIDSPEWIVRH